MTDEGQAASADEQYLEDVAEATTERIRCLGSLNDWYATALAGLLPGQVWENGAPMTAQSLHAAYTGRRAAIVSDCGKRIAAARARFADAAGNGVPLPLVRDDAAEQDPPEFPVPYPGAPGPSNAAEVAEAAPLVRVPDPALGILATAPTRAAPKRKKPRWPVPVLGIIAAALIIAWAPWQAGSQASSSSGSSGTGGSSYVAPSTTVDVLYEVDGSATGTNVSLATPTGTVQLNDKAVPLGNRSAGTRGVHYQMPRGHFVSLIAQNTGSSGFISCKITVDGVVVASNTSSGGYAIASCCGTAG